MANSKNYICIFFWTSKVRIWTRDQIRTFWPWKEATLLWNWKVNSLDIWMVTRKTCCTGIEILLEWGDNNIFRVLLFCAKCHFKDEIVTTSAFIFCTTHFSPISTQDPQFMSHDAKIGHSQFTHICYTGTLVIFFCIIKCTFLDSWFEGSSIQLDWKWARC